ncbi:MAG: hypothetical protein ACTS77_04505, partial [Arsenophonus sp. NC-TX2-MAG3]
FLAYMISQYIMQSCMQQMGSRVIETNSVTTFNSDFTASRRAIEKAISSLDVFSSSLPKFFSPSRNALSSVHVSISFPGCCNVLCSNFTLVILF